MIDFIHIDQLSKRFCYRVKNEEVFSKILSWAQQFPLVNYLDSNRYGSKSNNNYAYNSYEFILSFSYLNSFNNRIDSINHLNNNINNNSDWLLGYISYDLKNSFHQLESSNPEILGFDNIFFYSPDIVVYKKTNEIILESKKYIDIKEFTKKVEVNIEKKIQSSEKNIVARFSKEEYLETVNKIKQDIQNGNIYELNFCQEFYEENCSFDPWKSYKKLTDISPMPFSAYIKQDNLYLLSASPERYVMKKANRLYSQPIKGTVRRGKDKKEDEHLVNDLKNNPKERSENIMIVDLVRNDLSQTAIVNSVKVEELCGVYPFKQLHQMISTVSSKLRQDKNFVDILETSFPMGSMTGAPKLRAMKLIDKYEKTRRSLYSGSLGYIEPNGDFDFNVVIRSILYNSTIQYLSYSVGSAITIQSNAEQEYEECLLKAKAIKEIL